MKENKEALLEKIDEIYHIMIKSFPERELRTYEGQKALIDNSEYQVYTIREQGSIIAFLSCWILPSCVFIEHLATTEQCRGKGYGKDLILECIADQEKPVFLEIEPVTDLDPMTGRRAEFYKRLNFYLNEFSYQQQPLQKSHNPMELRIMSYGKPISEEEFLPYKKEIYSYVYKVEI